MMMNTKPRFGETMLTQLACPIICNAFLIYKVSFIAMYNERSQLMKGNINCI